MIPFQRQQDILNYLTLHRSATVEELANAVFTSTASVRRDLAKLEAGGLVERVYGGVVLTEYKSGSLPVNLRTSEHSAAKENIARRAAALVSDGESVILDSSSTARRMCAHLRKRHNLTVFTNSLRVVQELKDSRVTVYCTGGLFNDRHECFYGPFAENFIRGIHADAVFFSTKGIGKNGDITDGDAEEIALRRLMLTRSERRYYLCDSAKFGLVSPFLLCQKTDVTAILSESPLTFEE